MAWLNLTMSNQTVKNGLKAKKIKLPQMNFFLEKQLIKFSCHFHSAKFQNILRADPELWGSAIFGPKMTHLSWTTFFFGKNHYYCFHLPIHPFHWAKFIKNSYCRSRVAYPDDALFLGPKWFISPKQIFFWKIIKIILIYLLAPFIVQNFKKI